jgi:membrane protein YdbS with pleckstrin-like domain
MIQEPAANSVNLTAPSPDPRLLPPREHLDPRARTMWYVAEVIQTAIWLVIVGVTAAAVIRFTSIDSRWVILAAAVIFVFSIVEGAISPALRYRYWRYEIRDDEVDLQHGVLMKTRQLVPMSRIQHVDTRRGPLQQRFGLSSVVFFTAAGSMEIPALSQVHAADVRNRIAELAKVHDDL